MEYLKKDTEIIHYTKTPEYVYKAGLTAKAMVVYGRLFTRAQLSQKNNWTDENGNIYVEYTHEKLAADSNIPLSTVKKALRELAEKELIQIKRTGRNKPNKIFICYPDRDSSKRAIRTAQNEPQDSSKRAIQDSPNIAANKTINNITMNNKQKNRFHNFDQRDYSEEEIERLYEI